MHPRSSAPVLGLALGLMIAPALRAQVAAPLIPYQGRLELSGLAASGAHDFRFGLFTSATADATCLVTVAQPADACGLWWTEHLGTPVAGGAFAVMLGQNRALTSAALAQNQLYLAIAVRAPGATDYTLLQGLQRLADVPASAAARDFAVSGTLTVQGVATLGTDATAGRRTLAFARNSGDQIEAGKISYRPTYDNSVLSIFGAGTAIGSRKVRLWDDLQVNDTLSAGTLEGRGVVPVGAILLWSGSVASIPANFRLCNGSNGTPDLRGRFVVGYNPADPDHDAPGDSGGAKTHLHGVTHDHALATTTEENTTDETIHGGAGTAVDVQRDDHTHDLDLPELTVDSAASDGRPPYYTLAYIMRVE